MSLKKRGAFIVFEGCDKSGKSTQCSLLVNKLNKAGVSAQVIKFPDRTTPIGKMINDYLIDSNVVVEDHVIHLLFSANRWELMPRMNELLNSGVTLVVDRYTFSGVAFSSAKPNMSLDWCQQSERGLLRPDLVFYLTIPTDVASKRRLFGSERYEKENFQSRVAEKFSELRDDTWIEIDGNKHENDLSESIFGYVQKITKDHMELKKIWTTE